jgi:lysophospholipase L1-like esterase
MHPLSYGKRAAWATVLAAALLAPAGALAQSGGRRGRGAGSAEGTPPAAPPATRPATWRFVAASAEAAPGATPLAPDTLYQPGKYGWDMGTRPDLVQGGRAFKSDKPFYFSVDLPEGNYRITVTVGDPEGGGSSTTLKSESRRLMVEKMQTTGNQTAQALFIANVRTSHLPPPPQNAPGGDEVRLNSLRNPLNWDNKLTLEFNGSRPVISAIEIEPAAVPTIFIAGDSTVTDQSREPGASWGQMLPAFFKPDVAVANHAESGETLKSFITGLRLDKMLSQMKPGDYLLIQFGHNDEKKSWPQTYVEPETTWKAYLKVFIAEAKRRGATPVLITPMERQANRESHGDFPKAMLEVAKEESVACIDLHAMSKTLYTAMGDDLRQAFNDQTHHRGYGAYELAKCVVMGIRENKLPLAASIPEDFKDFDPAHPDPFASYAVPPSTAAGAGRPPQGN